MVSLKDSLELERAQAEKLKEIQLKHAMERLGALAGSIKMKDIQVLTLRFIPFWCYERLKTAAVNDSLRINTIRIFKSKKGYSEIKW